jgi:hypothetical protein
MGTKLQVNRTLITTKGDTMKNTMKRNLLLMFILVSLSALLGCASKDSPQSKSEQQLENEYLWSIHVGEKFEQKYQMAIVEETDQYTKYRSYDTRPNTPPFIYVTVKNGRVVSIWCGKF